MMLTEAEAVGIKWCPFVRIYAFNAPLAATQPAPDEQHQERDQADHLDQADQQEQLVIGPTVTGGPANRYADSTGVVTNPPNCRCLGSACMAWQWITAEGAAGERYGCCGLATSARPGEMD